MTWKPGAARRPLTGKQSSIADGPWPSEERSRGGRFTTSSEDAVLIDTNVLVYATDQTSPFHGDSRAFRERGRGGEFVPCVTPQILFEFYAVITDARRVGQPLSPVDAAGELARYLSDAKIRKVHHGGEIGGVVLSLLGKYKVMRQDIFDLV